MRGRQGDAYHGNISNDDIYKEANMKVFFSSNPAYLILPENYSHEGKGKKFAVTEVLAETLNISPPVFIKIKCSVTGNFDENSNKTDLVTIIPKNELFGTTIQYYRKDYENPDFLNIGTIGSVSLTLTDQNDNVISIGGWSLIYCSIKIINL